jgi:hypothetical protein
MNSEYVLVISMAGSITTSAVIWWWLQGALREILNQLCASPGSMDFWSRYMFLMLLIAPLMVVIIFIPDAMQTTTEVVRRIILTILLGHFVSFGLVGRSLFKAINRNAEQEKSFVSVNSEKG